jgi:hypothetical protein
LVVVLAVGIGPLSRRILAREAEQAGVELQVGAVWPAWWGIRLTDATASVAAVPAIKVHLDETRIGLGVFLGVRQVSARGVQVVARGPAAEIAAQLAAWRTRSHQRASTSGDTPRPALSLSDGALLWWDADSTTEPRVAVRGLTLERTSDGLATAADSVRAALGGIELDLRDATAKTNSAGDLIGAGAGSLAVSWTRTARRAVEASARPPEIARNVDVSTPLVDLPNLPDWQATALRATALLSDHFAPTARIDVASVTGKVSVDGSSAVTIGPGTLAITHDPTRVQADFAAGATDEGPSLTARLALPVGTGDTSLDVQGGPVSLSVLGLRDESAGLFDVARTTVSGRAHLALDAGVHSVTFDCTGSARNISLRDPRLAADDIRGLDVKVRARGTLSLPGDLRFDELAATVGALQIETNGALDQERDHVAAVLHISIPTTPCNTVLTSIPTALLPVASKMVFSGTFGAEGRLVFDSRTLDDLDLTYDVRDGCRATAVPTTLARDSLLHPFTHRIYLPDGSTQDEETGPGTAGWTSLDQISPFMEVAVTTTEDGAFRAHHGFNRGAIRASLIADLKTRRFVRGASTITMQLAKNLFLSREKTLSRKLEEVILTDYLEQALSKDEILELYFNVVEFGPAVYGLGAAADFYFGRTPADLDLAEAFFLASILPSPLRSGSVRDIGSLPDTRLDMLRALMRAARKRGLLSDEELAEGLRERVEFWHGGERPLPHTNLPTRARPEGRGSNGESDPGVTDGDLPP